MTKTSSNSKAEKSATGLPRMTNTSQGNLESFQPRFTSTDTDQVEERGEIIHERHTPEPVSGDNNIPDEKGEEVAVSDAKPYSKGPLMYDNSRDDYHSIVSLTESDQEAKVEEAFEQARDDNPPIPMSHSVYFAKDAGGEYSSKRERLSSMELAGEEHVPLPITELIDAKIANTPHKNETGIHGHGSINSSIPSMDNIAHALSGPSISATAYNRNNRTNNDASEALSFEIAAEVTHNQQDDISLDSDSRESKPAQNIDVSMPAQPLFTEPDIIIPEAFLVTKDEHDVEVLSDEFEDSSIPSAQVVLPSQYSLIIAGRKIHFGVLAAMFILMSLAIGLTIGFTLRNEESLNSRTQTISNHSAAALIKHDIETNVLRRNATFSQLDKYDSRNKALDWILFEDGMKVNASFSSLHQRYIMALLWYEFDPLSEWDLPDWLSGKHECEWYGVSCLDDKVTELELGELLP